MKELDPSATAEPARSMDQIVKDSIASARMASTFTSLFGLVSLLLATVGLYGLMAYSVNQRSREIGIRMALGASRNRVLTATLIRGTALMAIGIAVGLAGAFAATRLIRSLLYEVQAGDLPSFVVAVLVLGIVG
ncbi:MAG: FtsX-like permease family protein, partial [Blastocatellia bacterium]